MNQKANSDSNEGKEAEKLVFLKQTLTAVDKTLSLEAFPNSPSPCSSPKRHKLDLVFIAQLEVLASAQEAATRTALAG